VVMSADSTKEFKLGELADAAGVSPRTVRVYIAIGVLPGPVRAGRAAAYTRDHLAGIRRIQELQAEGLTLAEIRLRQSGDPEPGRMPRPVPVWRFQVTPDVTVEVRGDLEGWRMKRVIRGIAALTEHLRKERETQNEYDNT